MKKQVEVLQQYRYLNNKTIWTVKSIGYRAGGEIKEVRLYDASDLTRESVWYELPKFEQMIKDKKFVEVGEVKKPKSIKRERLINIAMFMYELGLDDGKNMTKRSNENIEDLFNELVSQNVQ